MSGIALVVGVLAACDRDGSGPSDAIALPTGLSPGETADTGAPGCVLPETSGDDGCDSPGDGASTALCQLAYASWTAGGQQWFAGYGVGIGDTDGDGVAEVAMGAQGTGQFEGDVPLWGQAFVDAADPGPHCMADASATLSVQGSTDFFGTALAVGDTDGDGFDDLLIGAPYGTYRDEGRAYLLRGAVVGDLRADRSAAVVFTGPEFGFSGFQVRITDLDGDGGPDLGVVVGDGGGGVGQVAILDPGGRRDQTLADAKAVLDGEESIDLAGVGLDTLGDGDGDGVSDLAIGAPGYGAEDQGRVYLMPGPIAATVSLADAPAIVTSSVDGAEFGYTIAGGGRDLDGDGLPDVAVGAPLYGPEGLPWMGQVVVLPGSLTGVHSAEAFPVRIDSDRPFAHLGRTVASPGDIDGDGHADLAIGAPDNWNFSYDPGRVFVFLGPLDGPRSVADAAWVLRGDRPGEGAGLGLGAGDVDHDGLADLMIGAPTNDLAGYAAGKVYLVLAADLP